MANIYMDDGSWQAPDEQYAWNQPSQTDTTQAPNDQRSPNTYTDQPAINPVSGTPYNGIRPIGGSLSDPTPQGLNYDNSLTNSGSPSGGGSSDPYSWIDDALRQAQSTDDPSYWRRVIAADPNGSGSAKGYWLGRIAQGDGALAVRNGTMQKFQDGPAVNQAMSGGAPQPQGNPSGYTDPSSMLYLDQVMQRLNALNKPQDTQIYDLLKSLTMARVNSLNDKPYTSAEDAALVTQYRDPLTQARDTAKAQKAEDLNRRGIGPTSGLFQSEMGKIDQAYTKGIAAGSNDMAVRAVNQRQQNADQQLALLGQLLGVQNSNVDRGNAQSLDAVNTAQLFPNFDEKRLADLSALGSENNTTSILNSLLGYGGLNQSATNQSNLNSANSAAMWGQILSYILAHANGN